MTQKLTNTFNLKIIGNGTQVIMFAHGFASDQTVWGNITPSFLEDYKIVLFDYIGSGNSDKKMYDSKRYHSLHGYADDVLYVIEELKLTDIIFVGHSVSAMIGALASIKKTHLFKKLIMIGASPHYLNDGGYKGGFEKEDVQQLLEMMESNFIGWASYLAPVALNNSENTSLTEDLAKKFINNQPGITYDFFEATLFSDHRDDVKKISVPTVIIQSTDDNFTPQSVTDYLSESIPENKIVYIEAKGHYPQLSHPEETARIILKHLS